MAIIQVAYRLWLDTTAGKCGNLLPGPSLVGPAGIGANAACLTYAPMSKAPRQQNLGPGLGQVLLIDHGPNLIEEEARQAGE
jgi:hypothetical protein